jgi:hypothetical protein
MPLVRRFPWLNLSPGPVVALGEGQEPESASGETRGRRGSGALMRGPISEAIIIVALGFFIGGIAGAIIHFTFDSSNAIVLHPASSHALRGAPDYPKR